MHLFWLDTFCLLVPCHLSGLCDWWLAHTFPLGLKHAADAFFLAGHLLLACTMSLEQTL